MPKAKAPNVLIVDNTAGKVFIVENNRNMSEIDKIMRKAPKKTTKPSEDMIIEEYLDEEYLKQLENEIIIKEEFDDLSLNLGSSEASKDAKDNVVKKDHPYTTVDGEQDPFQPYDSTLDEAETIVVEEQVFELTDMDQLKSSKIQHKSQQLTGKAACKYCETVFKTKEQLREHDCEYLQCDPKNFICRICKKELSKKTFSNHLHETLDCQYCNKGFLNPRNLKTHIRKLHADQEYIAPPSPKFNKKDPIGVGEPIEYVDEETGIVVRTYENKIIRKKYPRKKGRYECDLCGRILTTERSLNQHFLLHSKIYKYVCETCGEKFTTRTGIIKHACMNRQRKRPERDFRTVDVRTCKYCELSFPSLEENKEHDCEFQYIDDPKMFRCRYCDFVMSKNSFNKHMARHLDTKEYFCHLCDKQLANESSLETHLSTHSGHKKYVCNECDKSFISKVLLIRHSRFHGKKIPVFQCNICKKSVASKYHLKSHIVSMHSNVHECKICKEQFPSKTELKDHYTASHEPFTCSVCSKTFLLERYLKMHEKLHKNISTQYFRCPYCQRKFSRRAIADHVFKLHAENFEIWRDNNLDLI